MDTITLSPVATDSASVPDVLLSEQFLEFLRREKSASPCTVRSYRADLRQFGQFLSGAIGPWTWDPSPSNGDLNQKFLACTPLMGVDFRSYLMAQNYCSASIARKLSVLKSIYGFLIHGGMMSISPFSAIRAPKWTKQAPKYIDQEQVRRLLNAPGHADVLAVRDSAILELLYSSGIRVSEMVELKTTDVDLANGTVHIRGLSPINRVAPINPQAIAALKRYLPMRVAQCKPGHELGDRIFLNKDGNSLSTRSVRRKLEGYLAVAGLPADLSSSSIRHSFAVHLAEQGADPKRVQALLGYRNLNSAKNYTRLAAARRPENQPSAPNVDITSRGATAA